MSNPLNVDVNVQNQCLYTGARVFLEQHGCLVAADIYCIEGGNVRIIKYNIGSAEYGADFSHATHTADITDAWHRPGVIVMDKFNLTEASVND